MLPTDEQVLSNLVEEKLRVFHSKFSYLMFLFVIVALRIAIGVHFYHEGSVKRSEGNWSAEGFFAAAKGPFAPFFHDVVEDIDDREILCVTELTDEEGSPRFVVNPRLTELLWEDFADQATSHYRFSADDYIKELEREIDLGRKMIDEASEKRTKPIDVDEVNKSEIRFRETIEVVKSQVERLNKTLQDHLDELGVWLAEHETELIAHFSTANRLNGFDRDGQSAGLVSTEVEALRGQVDSIRGDRRKLIGPWVAEVKAIWDSFEKSVNELRVHKQLRQPTLQLHRPFDQPNSRMKWINRVIPYFDMAVGISLIFGIFVRLSSLIGAAFLASVALSQPFWIAGTIPTAFQIIEMFALLVLFAVSAGRYFGIDYFMWHRVGPNESS